MIRVGEVLFKILIRFKNKFQKLEHLEAVSFVIIELLNHKF